MATISRLLAAAFAVFFTFYLSAQTDNIGIGTTTPDPSAALDITASDKGLLPPRLTSMQRLNISNPAEGLVVYDTGSKAFYFFDGAQWLSLAGGGGGAGAVIIDADNDTKVEVEQNPDEDIIRFSLAGTEHWVMAGARLENRNSGNSVFIGEGAGASDDGSDNRNVAVGYQALFSNTTGNYNTANGNLALAFNTTGSSNTANGNLALSSNTSGNYNTANGSLALNSNTTGSYNIANGSFALNSNTTGRDNIANGSSALYSNTDGSYNTAHGTSVLYSNTIGNYNTANGYFSLFSNTDGDYNTALGSQALGSNTTGGFNTAFGTSALNGTNPGNGNTAIGAFAGNTADGINYATAIGYDAKAGCSYCLALGGTGPIAVRVGIGTATPDPSAAMDIQADNKGLLLPRLTTIQRHNINTPAEGLMVYDTDSTAFYFYDGAQWLNLADSLATRALQDVDKDTKMQVEESPDEDLIRFDLGGTERWVMSGARLENRNSGNSVFIGEGAGASDDLSDNRNVALGYLALNSNNTGSNNLAFGTQALYSNTTGNYNTANGYQALQANTTGSNNTANGYQALQDNTTGFQNTANGAYTLGSNTTGIYNTAIGNSALALNTDGNFNTASGYLALESNTIGDLNTATGRSALALNTDGNNNTATGTQALTSNSTGDSNTANGSFALFLNSAGNNNTALGADADVTAGGLSNATAIGYSASVSTSNKVRIGNTSVTVIEGQVDWSFPSDARFKFNVDDSAVPGLAFIKRLRPVTYQFDSRKYDEHLMQNMPDSLKQQRLGSEEGYASSSARVQTGFLAQEVEQACKELGYDFSGLHVPENETDNYSLAYGSFVPLLVKAVQELADQVGGQQEIIEQQRGQIRELESQLGEVSELKQRLARLEAALLPSDRVTEKTNE